MSTTWSARKVGSGVPGLRWQARRHASQYADYEGHTFVTADPKGLARSVCEGFADDMDWIVTIHNAVIADGWRARLARRLLRLPHPSANAAYPTTNRRRSDVQRPVGDSASTVGLWREGDGLVKHEDMPGWVQDAVANDAVEQVGWIDEYGQLWSLGLRNGAVTTDRPVYAVKGLSTGGYLTPEEDS